MSQLEQLFFHDSIYVLGGKWKTPILVYLARNEKDRNCFLQIKHDIGGISAKMLSKELQDFVMNKMVKRTVHNTKPITVEYAITEHGKTFIPMVEAFIEGGMRHRTVIKSK